jgi:hypothetical protein
LQTNLVRKKGRWVYEGHDLEGNGLGGLRGIYRRQKHYEFGGDAQYNILMFSGGSKLRKDYYRVWGAQKENLISLAGYRSKKGSGPEDLGRSGGLTAYIFGL